MSAKSDPRVPLFAYGTLRKGEVNHSYLADAQYLGVTQTIDPLSMFICGGVPVLTEQPTTLITGEMYLLPDARALDYVDGLEGHPDHYLRKLISVNLNGRINKAWVYLWPHEIDAGYVFLNSGDFKDRPPQVQKSIPPKVILDWESAWAA